MERLLEDTTAHRTAASPPPEAAVRPCPLCAGRRARERCRVDGHAIVECGACRLRFVGRAYDDEELAAYYDRDYFQGAERAFAYEDYAALEHLKAQTFEARLAQVEVRLGRRGRLLDVGCATGACVRVAVRRGWDAAGIDVSAYAVEAANQELPGRCVQATPQTAPFPPESFDVVTLFDCLEHTPTPLPFLRACVGLLRREGLCVVETPDAGGLLARLLGRRWPYYRPPEHLVYFSRETVTLALRQVGCQVERSYHSVKRVTPAYVIAQTRSSNPWLSRALRRTLGRLPGMRQWPLNLPTGSLWVIARKPR